MNNIAIIPARGGSVGIPNKNIIAVGGKPLIAWTIEAAVSSGVFDTVYVSSDSEEILTTAQQYGALPLKRPDALATSESIAIDVLIHAVETLQHMSVKPNVVAYLMPTSPLRTAAHIQEAMEQFQKSEAAALISVVEAPRTILKALVLNKKDTLSGICNDQYPFMNRQNLPPVYMQNGALYFIRTDALMEYKNFIIPGKTIPFLMHPEDSIDLDRPEQIVDIEVRLSKN